MEKSRVCQSCEKDLPLTDYRANKTRKWGRDGLALICRLCDNARSRDYYHRKKYDPDFKEKQRLAHRRAYLKRRYGIDPDDYTALRAAQDGACKICGTVPEGWGLVIDKEGASLLCPSCSSGLGMFKRDRKLLARASEYLKTGE